MAKIYIMHSNIFDKSIRRKQFATTFTVNVEHYLSYGNTQPNLQIHVNLYRTIYMMLIYLHLIDLIRLNMCN